MSSSLLDFMNEAAALKPASWSKESDTWVGREPEMALLERVLPSEKIGALKARGIVVRRALIPNNDGVSRLLITVYGNKTGCWIEVSRLILAGSIQVALRLNGKEVDLPLGTTAEFSEFVFDKCKE